MALNIDPKNIAAFLFENTSDKIIQLTLGGIETTYELFCFCTTLLIQGIVLYCGNNVDIDTITEEVIEKAILKMANAGIRVRIASYKKAEGQASAIMLASRKIITTVNDYILLIHSQGTTYEVNFDVVRHAHILPKHVF